MTGWLRGRVPWQRYWLLFPASLMFMKGWSAAAATPSAPEPKNLGRGIADERSSEDPSFQHPRAPPPPREADVSLDSTLVTLKFKEGDWSLIVDKNMPYAQLLALMRNICEEAGDSSPKDAVQFSSAIIADEYGYQRTTFWFERDGSFDVFEKYLAGIVATAPDRPVHVLEVGSFEGGSALWFAEHLLPHPDSMLICIDTWAGSADLKGIEDLDMPAVEGRFRHNMARAPNRERVSALKGDSLLSLAGLVAGGRTSTFDVIYVDGDHGMASVLADAILSFRLLKVGGFLIFDDMVLFPTVGRAMECFVEALGDEHRLEVLYSKEQMVITKTAEDQWATPTSTVNLGTDPFLS